MKNYSTKISLTKNGRGVYSIDPTIGCGSGVAENKKGCYGDCYSAKSAKMYGYDFSNTILRDFENEKHLYSISNEINRIDLPFIRMGSSGDPSENWEHTLRICKQLSKHININQYSAFDGLEKNKQIVIITKHWQTLTDSQLTELSKYNICVNTSVSAIDNEDELTGRMNEYKRIKPYCKSVLRIVSFDFNLDNVKGHNYYKIQLGLFKNKGVIDTVFRASKGNPLVRDGVINTHKTKFLGKNALVSKYNKKTYFGKCGNCLEMCGVNSSLAFAVD